jgi:PAS domain S-box-containing protein
MRILGLRYDDLLSKYVADWEPLTFFEDGSPCPVSEYPVAKVLTTGRPSGPLTLGVLRPEGGMSWAVFRAEPVLDKTKKLVGAIVTFLDITARKTAEEELRRKEQKWRSLGEHLPDFVIVADANATILSINRVLEGHTEEQVVGQSCYAFIEPTHLPEWKYHFHRVLSTATSARFETLAPGPQGAMSWYETIIVPLLDGQEVTRVLVVARDITERRMMLANIAERERLASVGMLSASVAHEIMNPLTYVLANLDFALGERCTEEARRIGALTSAREGARRMQQIVWDLRSLGRTGGDLFYVDARAMIETAIRLAGPELASAVDIVLDLKEVPPVIAAESRLCQVIINLLVNAAQAQNPANGRGEIRVSTRHDETAGFVALEVADTGDGISPDSMPRIFEPFYTTKRSGTGLGLSICRDILQRMGGRIEVSSVVGQGSTFVVWLPTNRT